MSPKVKFGVILGMFVVAAGVIGGIIMYMTNYVDNYMDHTEENSELSLKLADMDMMHDAIRADVILAGTGKDVSADIKNHVARIQADLNEASSMTDFASQDVKDKFEAVRPNVNAYTEAALNIVAGHGSVDGFALQFNALEVSLGALVDSAAAMQKQLVNVGEGVVQQMRAFALGAILVICTLGIAFAYMELRRAIAMLENQAKLTAISRSQGTIEFTLKGIVLTANDNFLRLMGYTLEEARGAHHSKFVTPEYKQSPEYIEFWRKLSSGEFVAGEFQRVAKNGHDVWIQASYNPVLDVSGKPYKIVKFATDITEQMQVRLKSERIKQVVAESISTVSAAVSETQGIVENVARGADEMMTSVQDIAQNMGDSRNSISQMLMQNRGASEAVNELSLASESMNVVVELIQNIASQISLLALNAAIEAARAGEAGRGFAVVSDEVKKLAAQTSSATSDISSEIKKMQAISGRVVGALGEISTSVTSVSDGVNIVATATDEQSSVATGISRSMKEVEMAIASINASILEIANTTEHGRAA